MERPSLKIVSLFSGTGFQEMGMKNCDLFNVESIASCDMDNYAVISYAAIHCGLTQGMVDTYDYPSREEMAEDLIKLNMGYDFKKQKKYDWMKKARGKDQFLNKVWLACKLSNNLGDISNITEIPKCNMMTYSFPCTDLSIAGAQAGMEVGTRSGLVYEVLRLLKVSHKPEYLLMENVDALISKKFKHKWEEIVEELSELGYNTYYQVLNAKDCGVPQNRKRVFGLSIRKDIDNGTFTFPIPFDNGKRLKDVLLPSEEVDEKYYIENDRSKKLIEDLIANGSLKWIDEELYNEDGTPFEEGIAFTSKTREQVEGEQERWEFDDEEYPSSFTSKSWFHSNDLCFRSKGKRFMQIKYPNEIIQLGGMANQIVSTRDNPQRYRVYDIYGIAPALNTAQGGGLNPYIVVKDYKNESIDSRNKRRAY